MGFKTYTCPIEKSCGGCEWLAVPYPIQLRRKRERVESLFQDILPGTSSQTDGALPRLPMLGMDEDSGAPAGAQPIAYRHKAATPFAPGTHGAVRSGFYAHGTHRIVPCAACLVEDPRCREALNAVARAAEECGVPAYDEDRGRGLLRHAVARAGWATDEVLLTIVTNGEKVARLHEFLDRIQELAPCVTAIAQNVNQRRTNAILGRESRALVGGGVMHDELSGVSFELGPTNFYQTNPFQTERLYACALDAAGITLDATGPARLLDAYCGIGTIGLVAAARMDDLEVLGVESGVEAVACARRNAEANGLTARCRFVAADATAYMRDARKAQEHFDAIVLDPPRAGSTKAFLEGVSELAPSRIVYVSCNPETQRRDCDVLLGLGWHLDSLACVDMFPHTQHVETLASLSRD